MTRVGSPTTSASWSTESDSSDARLQKRRTKVEDVVAEFRVSDHYRAHLDTLLGYDIVILCDDSRSMKGTRWENLEETVKLVLKLASAFDEDGVDLFAFKREERRNVVDDEEVQDWFDERPSNKGTPLTTRIRAIVNEYLNNEKPVLLLIATDGEPNDGGSSARGKAAFTAFMRERERDHYLKTHFPINFLLFNEDQSIVDYYGQVDEGYANVDVTNTYLTERRQVRAHNPDHPFTKGDWLVKMLLGSIVAEIDDLDERRVTVETGASGGSGGSRGGCTIL